MENKETPQVWIFPDIHKLLANCLMGQMTGWWRKAKKVENGWRQTAQKWLFSVGTYISVPLQIYVDSSLHNINRGKDSTTWLHIFPPLLSIFLGFSMYREGQCPERWKLPSCGKENISWFLETEKVITVSVLEIPHHCSEGCAATSLRLYCGKRQEDVQHSAHPSNKRPQRPSCGKTEQPTLTKPRFLTSRPSETEKYKECHSKSHCLFNSVGITLQQEHIELVIVTLHFHFCFYSVIQAKKGFLP